MNERSVRTNRAIYQAFALECLKFTVKCVLTRQVHWNRPDSRCHLQAMEELRQIRDELGCDLCTELRNMEIKLKLQSLTHFQFSVVGFQTLIKIAWNIG